MLQQRFEAAASLLRERCRPFARWTALIVFCAVTAFVVARSSPFALFDRFSADVRISWFAPTMPLRDDIVLIAVTDDTLAQFPFQAPINRGFLAQLTKDLDARGARVIAFDILFDTATLEGDDAALRAAFAEAQADIVLVDFPIGADSCRKRADAGESAVLPAFAEMVTMGDGALCEDRGSGVVRAVARAPSEQGFAAQIVDAATDGEAAEPPHSDIRFAVTPNDAWPFPTYPAHHVANLPEEWIRGRIAIIGTVTPFADRHITPLRLAPVSPPSGLVSGVAPSDTLPGVLAHAYAVAQRLDGRIAPRLSAWREGVLALLGAVIGMALGAGGGRWWAKAGLLVTAPIAYAALAFTLFALGGPLLGVSSFSLGVLASGGAAVAIGEQHQRRHSAHVKRAFEHYLAPDIVDELVREPASLTLAAHERDISVLISDIENFSRFIDQNDRSAVSDVINTYLDRMIAVVLAHGGAVDKIVGDSVHALFSAPVEDPDHRRNAVLCSIAMIEAAREVEAQVATDGLTLGRTRIGVHSGAALVGNFGGAKRFDYTAHGSTINIAARLEAANKVFGTSACVSAAARVASPHILYRTVGDVVLRGFDDHVTVFEPLGADDDAKQLTKRYEAALAQSVKAPEQAQAALEALSRDHPDALIEYQLERARAGTLGTIIRL